MQAAEYNQWEFCPINLTLKEVNNPLSVLAAFFSDDWLPDQAERLKQWRDYVLKDEFFVDAKNSPAGLLHFHKINICLIEAGYLLLNDPDRLQLARQSENIVKEKETWRNYPENLTDAELLDPYAILTDFFNAYSLPQYRLHLYDWLEYGLSLKAANEFISTVDLIYVYENLQKLYSSAWLIIQRSSGQPYLKQAITGLGECNVQGQVKLHNLDNNTASANSEKIGLIVSIIKHKLSTVQAVLYLGTAPLSNKIFLVIFTSNDEQRQAQSLSSMIEESCQHVAEVVALVHHAFNLFTGLANGHTFFNRALNSPTVYLSGDLLLPIVPAISKYNSSDDFKWERWYSQGKEFFSGAEYYLKMQAYSAALFSLHQCVECLLIAVIRGVLDYRVNNHNLSRLLKITEIFTGDLVKAFNLDNTDSADLFDILKHVYVNVRYKDKYKPDMKAVCILYEIVKEFIPLTEAVYKRHVLVNNI